jgi:hypothetical protein
LAAPASFPQELQLDVLCSMTFTPEILVPCSETLDGFGSGAPGKYPHGYLVRDTITPGGHTRWVRGFCAETCERSQVVSEVGGEKDSITIQLAGRFSPTIHVPLGLRSSWVSRCSQQSIIFICLYTLSSILFTLSHYTLLNPCHEGLKSHGIPFKWHSCWPTAICCGRLRAWELQAGCQSQLPRV